MAQHPLFPLHSDQKTTKKSMFVEHLALPVQHGSIMKSATDENALHHEEFICSTK